MSRIIKNKNRIFSFVMTAVLFVVSFYSVTYAAPKYSDPRERAEYIEYLDEKRNTVLALTTASTTASTALTLLKDDWATPIANELAELSGYFMVILAAIVLEKYLITLSGLIVFKYIIPLACALLGGYILRRNMEWAKILAIKLISFGLIFFLLVPASIEVCQVIEDTYDTSIQAALTSAQNAADLAENGTNREKNFLQKAISSITGTVSAAIDSVKNILNNFIEAVAIMLITSCVIPILMIFIFVWLINALTGLNITLPQPVRVQMGDKHRKIPLPEDTD